jgi:hypothetical protein
MAHVGQKGIQIVVLGPRFYVEITWYSVYDREEGRERCSEGGREGVREGAKLQLFILW